MGLMDMEKQQRNQDSTTEPLHHGTDGDGGTGTTLLVARQVSTAPVPARALTVNLMEQVCKPKNLV